MRRRNKRMAGLALAAFRPGRSGGYRELAALGIGVGTDAALACLSLPDAGIGIAASAFFLFAAHFLFICCGMAAADAVRPLASGLKVLSGLFLVGLGLFRLLE